MFRKKTLWISFLCAFLLLWTSASFAAPFLPGEVQLLEDEDAEVLLDSAGDEITVGLNTQIAVGNLFGGILKIQATQNVPSGDNDIDLQGTADTFTSIFLIEAESIIDGPTIDNIQFGAATQAQWNSVFGFGGLLDISSYFDVSDLDGLGTGLSTGTMSLFFDGVNFFDADPSLPTYSASTLSFVDGGNLLYEFGFTGAGGVALADEFFFTRGENALFPSQIGSTNPTNRISLNVTEYWGGPPLLPHNHLGTSVPFDSFFTGPTQLQGKGDFAGTATGQWGIITDTDLYINAVPEPSTLLLLGAGLLGLAGLGRKKFKA